MPVFILDAGSLPCCPNAADYFGAVLGARGLREQDTALGEREVWRKPSARGFGSVSKEAEREKEWETQRRRKNDTGKAINEAWTKGPALPTQPSVGAGVKSWLL